MAEGSSKGALAWIHTDTRGINAAQASAYNRALRYQWSRDADSVQDQRALVVYALMAAASLSPRPPELVAGVVNVDASARADRTDSQGIQLALVWGVIYLLGGNADKLRAGAYDLTARIRVETEDGAMPEGPQQDTGAFPFLAAVCVINATLALAGVIALWLSQQNEIDGTEIAANERVQKHAATLATLSAVVEQHVAQEQEKGATLEWTPQELAFVDDLKASIKSLEQTPAADLKTVPDLGKVSGAVAGAVTDAGTTVKNIGEAAKGAARGAGEGAGIVLALFAGWWLWEHQEGRRAAAAA